LISPAQALLKARQAIHRPRTIITSSVSVRSDTEEYWRCRNAEQARRAAEQIWNDEWNKKHDAEPVEPKAFRMFAAFVKETYLPWAKNHKPSYNDDVRITTMLTDFFKDKRLTEIKPVMVEQFKANRPEAGKALATINRELSVLSKVFTVAIVLKKQNRIRAKAWSNLLWTTNAFAI
jgi:hypothetical protein